MDNERQSTQQHYLTGLWKRQGKHGEYWSGSVDADKLRRIASMADYFYVTVAMNERGGGGRLSPDMRVSLKPVDRGAKPQNGVSRAVAPDDGDSSGPDDDETGGKIPF